MVKLIDFDDFRNIRPDMFCKKGVLKNVTKFTGKHLYRSLVFNKFADLRPATLFKKWTLTQVFSCEFCEIFKNTFSYKTPSVAASVIFFENHVPMKFKPCYREQKFCFNIIVGYHF